MSFTEKYGGGAAKSAASNDDLTNSDWGDETAKALREAGYRSLTVVMLMYHPFHAFSIAHV